jgi:O-antigen ligase
MKKTALWIVLGALFLIPFLPLYVAEDMFFPFITSKGFWFRILIDLALASYVVLAIADKEYRPKWSWTLVIYGALVAWMFIANLFAVNPHKAFWSNYERMDGWITLVHVFLFFVIAGSVLSAKKLWRRWWLTAIGASVLIAGYSILQLMGQLEIHQGGVRTDASLGNAAYLAAYLLFMIAAALWQAVESKGWLRHALFALAAIHTIILFSTATRGAILGLVGAAALASVLWMILSGKAGRKAGAIALVSVVVCSALFLGARETEFVRNDPTLSRIASISVEDGATRFTLWGMALEGVATRPLVGWGQEGYAYIFNEYFKPSLYAQEPWFDRAHSVYVDWLVAGGIPGLLLFLALLSVSAVALLRSNASRSERIFLVAALSAYAFQALFVFDNIFTYVFLAALLATAHEATAKPFPALTRVGEPSGSTVSTVVVPAALVAGIALVYVVNVPGMTGNLELIRAVSAQDPYQGLAHFKAALGSGTFAKQEVREQLLSYASGAVRNPSVPADVKQELISLALSEAEAQLAEVPEDVRMRLQYAQALESAGNIAKAQTEAEIAHSYSPKKQGILFQLGLGKWKAGDITDAQALFKEAYELDTRSPEAARYMAAGAYAGGDRATGDSILLSTFGTTTIDHDLLRFAYYNTGMFTELLRSAYLKRETMPHTEEANYLYIQALVLAGRAGDARAELAQLTKTHPEWSANLAQLTRELGL